MRLNYELIEKYKLYYLQPSYWRKINRHCTECGLKWTKQNPVNYGIAFELSTDKHYYHYDCLPKPSNPIKEIKETIE